MTLSIGDHVVKLGPDGKPIPVGDTQEAWVEFEVIDLISTDYRGEADVVQFVKLRKVR